MYVLLFWLRVAVLVLTCPHSLHAGFVQLDPLQHLKHQRSFSAAVL